MNYYKLNLVLTSGVLIGVWSNFFYQIKGITLDNFKQIDTQEFKETLDRYDVVL